MGAKRSHTNAVASATTQATNAAASAATAAGHVTSAQAAQSASETARDDSQTARDDSQTAQAASESARDTAQDHRDDAQKLATNAEDSQFTLADGSTTGYSALHHKEKALDAQTASESARDTSLAHSNTASGHAADALSHSNTASGHASTALGHSNTAQGHANTAQTQAGLAAASATSASGYADTAEDEKDLAVLARQAAESARDATLTAYDNFDDRYLGAKTGGDPTVDNDGNSLVAGAIYFDQTNSIMKVFTGSTWVAAYADGATLVAKAGDTMTGNLTVNATINANSLNVDSGTLFVDSSNNRVGVNLGSGNTPQSNLHVKGGQRWEDTVNGNILDLQHYSSYSFLYRSNGALRLSGQGAASTNYLELNNSGGFTYAGNNVWHAGNLDSILDLGITDGTNGQALKTDGAGNLSFGDVATSTAWADVTGKPTTISGFGITDAFDGATTSLTGTNFSASSPFQFLNGGNAQGIRVNSLYAGTSYSADGSASGMVDTLNGYRVGGTQVIDSSRNLTNIGNINGYGIAENGGNKILKTASNGYIQIQDWINVGSAGLYSSTANGAHFRPNTATSYATWRTDGSRGGYDGILFDDGGQQSIMFDSSRNGGIYAQNGGRWVIYHHYGNNCLGVGHSTTSSAYELYVSGDIYATGNITAYSDARAKENVETIDGALGIVEQMRGVYYNKIDNPDKTREMGFLAQEVNAIEGASELVTYAEDIDQYAVSYGNTAALLVEAVKELSAEVKTLKAEIEELKKG